MGACHRGEPFSLMRLLQMNVMFQVMQRNLHRANNCQEVPYVGPNRCDGSNNVSTGIRVGDAKFEGRMPSLRMLVDQVVIEGRLYLGLLKSSAAACSAKALDDS